MEIVKMSTPQSNSESRDELLEKVSAAIDEAETIQMSEETLTDKVMQLFDKELAKRVEGAKLTKARYSNIESVVHGELVKWGWNIQTANDVQREITEQVIAYMNQYTTPKRATLNTQTKEEK